LQSYNTQRNKLSEEIGSFIKAGKTQEAAAAKEKVTQIKTEISAITAQVGECEKKLIDAL
jgi:seryl-tRNA synthetase